MFDVPVDAWYAWVGTSLLAAAALAAALSIPAIPPPDAGAAANAIDAVAARPAATVDTVWTTATAVRVGPDRISLRNAAGTRSAPLVFGPVTPVAGDDRLDRLAAGADPEMLFDHPTGLARAADAARDRAPGWRRTDGELVVRRVRWEGYDVVIVAW